MTKDYKWFGMVWAWFDRTNIQLQVCLAFRRVDFPSRILSQHCLSYVTSASPSFNTFELPGLDLDNLRHVRPRSIRHFQTKEKYSKRISVPLRVSIWNLWRQDYYYHRLLSSPYYRFSEAVWLDTSVEWCIVKCRTMKWRSTYILLVNVIAYTCLHPFLTA